MSPLQIPPWRVLITVYAALLYVAFVVGLCVLFVSLLRRTAPPSPSPNRRQTQPGDAVLRLAIWAITLSAGALFNLPTAPKKETQFDEVLAMVYGVTMFLTFNLGWVLLCLNLRNKGTDLQRLMWVELGLVTFGVALKISLAMEGAI
ncbi:hypothetical protein QJS10_CPB11g01425 [Acorus calamus]|uniref:Integral membrane protein n=1 Tax=Acorus calamus TaxID=4465 RepID=A0AAV9DXZ6_ACOCL|nr:hypothetical protein QJS10_CPB11g01425 [Acorus calamus]